MGKLADLFDAELRARAACKNAADDLAAYSARFFDSGPAYVRVVLDGDRVFEVHGHTTYRAEVFEKEVTKVAPE